MHDTQDEYKVLYFGSFDEPWQDKDGETLFARRVNEVGRDGWELVNVLTPDVGLIAVLRRDGDYCSQD